ncbi:hypothetical protein EVAR_5743_1 [Eumeta japonica]|uniref:Uncharacterized protein n=1 Tax=Eumeta variegata TaxID=151549 RepID=A0A4C1T455_EUMVA|nr:hypothetical protein EVAR_5743_1 [Eumeta japonica]
MRHAYNSFPCVLSVFESSEHARLRISQTPKNLQKKKKSLSLSVRKAKQKRSTGVPLKTPPPARPRGRRPPSGSHTRRKPGADTYGLADE